MLEGLKERIPEGHIQAFTAIELGYLAELAKLPLDETLKILKNAGVKLSKICPCKVGRNDLECSKLIFISKLNCPIYEFNLYRSTKISQKSKIQHLTICVCDSKSMKNILV